MCMNPNEPNPMNHRTKSIWTEIIRLAITVLSAVAAALGVQSCC